jgi:hypothetical protein
MPDVKRLATTAANVGKPGEAVLCPRGINHRSEPSAVAARWCSLQVLFEVNDDGEVFILIRSKQSSPIGLPDMVTVLYGPFAGKLLW